MTEVDEEEEVVFEDNNIHPILYYGRRWYTFVTNLFQFLFWFLTNLVKQCMIMISNDNNTTKEDDGDDDNNNIRITNDQRYVVSVGPEFHTVIVLYNRSAGPPRITPSNPNDILYVMSTGDVLTHHNNHNHNQQEPGRQQDPNHQPQYQQQH